MACPGPSGSSPIARHAAVTSRQVRGSSVIPARARMSRLAYSTTVEWVRGTQVSSPSTRKKSRTAGSMSSNTTGWPRISDRPATARSTGMNSGVPSGRTMSSAWQVTVW